MGTQSRLMLHRTRHLFIRQHTAVINANRAHFAEFGIVVPVGLCLLLTGDRKRALEIRPSHIDALPLVLEAYRNAIVGTAVAAIDILI
jgi:hypothetical protein